MHGVEHRAVARIRISVASAASVAIHAVLLACVLRAEPQPLRDDSPRADPWAGDGLEVDAIREMPASEASRDGTPASPPPERDSPAPLEPAHAAPPEPARAAPEPAAARDSQPSVDPRTVTPRAEASETNTPPAPSAAAAPPSSPFANTPPLAESAAATVEGAASDAGVFGAAGLPPGVRHLALAFARALPKGAHTDAAFRELSLGKLGEARIRLRVDEDGKLGPLEFVDERARETLPAPIVRMLENALRLLAFGRFSLSTQKLEPGVLSLRVRVELSDEPPSVAENAQPNHVRELKGPASGTENPKRAWFVLNSGRRVDAWVYEE